MLSGIVANPLPDPLWGGGKAGIENRIQEVVEVFVVLLHEVGEDVRHVALHDRPRMVPQPLPAEGGQGGDAAAGEIQSVLDVFTRRRATLGERPGERPDLGTIEGQQTQYLICPPSGDVHRPRQEAGAQDVADHVDAE